MLVLQSSTNSKEDWDLKSELRFALIAGIYKFTVTVIVDKLFFRVLVLQDAFDTFSCARYIL